MPELPEVEGGRRLVADNCAGKKIVAAAVADDEKVINDVKPSELEEALVGRTLVRALRRGKQMWCEMDTGPALLLHFGMTGGVAVRGTASSLYKTFSIDHEAQWPPKYCKLELTFEDGTQLAYCDARRFGKVRFLQAPETRPPISELGWDPVLDWPPLEEFAARLGAQRRAVKALLLDQSFSAGVGNWVADEVLFQARIHPEQPANSIPPDQVAALHAAVRDVCQLACSVNADSSCFPDDWLFHFRWGKGSKSKSKVAGHTIDHITVGGRTSAYVPALQKLSKAAVAAAGAKAAAGSAAAAASGAARGGKGAAQGSKKKAAVAAAVAVVEGSEAAAAEVAVVAAAAAEAAPPAGSRKRRGKQSQQSQQAQQEAGAGGEADKPTADGPAAGAGAAAAAAAAGRGTKRFRTRGPAAGGAPTAAAAAGGGATATEPLAANPASSAPAGRKRKAAAGRGAAGSDAGEAAAAGVRPGGKRSGRSTRQ